MLVAIVREAVAVAFGALRVMPDEAHSTTATADQEAEMDDALGWAYDSTMEHLETALAAVVLSRQVADEGDLNGALAELHLNLTRSLDHAQDAAIGIDRRLRELGGTYPPP